jgi:hypothetical protein
MDQKKSALLVLSGIFIGCGAAAVAPTGLSRAQNNAGAWGCYVADRFPDMKSAAEWGRSDKIREGLDQVAANAAAGTILAINPGREFPDVVCVKH